MFRSDGHFFIIYFISYKQFKIATVANIWIHFTLWFHWNG